MTEHTVECGWCHGEVVSFVHPPAMIEISAEDKERNAWPRQFWRICAECHIALIKLIASRDVQEPAGASGVNASNDAERV